MGSFLRKLTSFVEEFSGVLSREGDVTGNVAEELNDVREVVLVARVVLARVRLEEVVAGRHLESHARRRPDVGRGAISCAQQDLEAAVLSRLDVFREVVILLYKRILCKVTKDC